MLKLFRYNLSFCLVLLATRAFAFHALEEQGREHLTSEQELSEIFQISRKDSVQEKLRALIQDRTLSAGERGKKTEDILLSHERRIDELLMTSLAGKSLFPCEIPGDVSKRPKLIISGEIHATEAALARQKELLSKSHSKDDDEKILYAVEGPIYGSVDSIKAWGQMHKLGTISSPLVRGIESLESKVMSMWILFAEAGTSEKLLNAKDDEAALKHLITVRIMRLALMKSMVTDLTSKNAFTKIEKNLTKKPITNLFSHLTKFKAQYDEEKVNALLKKLNEQGFLSDAAGWDTLVKEAVLNLYESKYGQNAFKAARAELEAFLKTPTMKSDFAREHLVDRRNIDFAISIGNLYCEAIKQRKDLYVTLGANHVYGTQRLLKSAVPGLAIEFEFTPGTLKVLSDRDNGIQE